MSNRDKIRHLGDDMPPQGPTPPEPQPDYRSWLPETPSGIDLAGCREWTPQERTERAVVEAARAWRAAVLLRQSLAERLHAGEPVSDEYHAAVDAEELALPRVAEAVDRLEGREG